MKKELTDRQRAVFEFIRDHLGKHGAPPTVREIGRYMKISSTNGVRQHVEALVTKGYLKKQKLIARGLELAGDFLSDARKLPLVGSVPAGRPIDAIENFEGEIAIDKAFAPKSDSFTLRVVGDSMKDAGILDGDLVVVQKQSTARSGEIIVAIIGEEATVKRFYPEGNKIRLQPANDDFEPIIVDRRSPVFSIAGKVVGLLRKF